MYGTSFFPLILLKFILWMNWYCLEKYSQIKVLCTAYASSCRRGYWIKQKNNVKTTSCISFQLEVNHETRIAKSGKFKKITGSNTRLNYFSFNFLRLTEEVEALGEKRWSKQSYLETSREDKREAHTFLAYCFTVLTCTNFNRLVMS